MSRIYHLLPEDEPFSEWKGGAISRWAANVLRAGDEVIVCPEADTSWGFAPERVLELPGWKATSPIHPLLYRMPWTLQKRFYTRLFQPFLDTLQPGDVLYTHNRPESAAVLAKEAGARGIRVVLHMHNSHLTRASRPQLDQLQRAELVVCSRYLDQELQRELPGRFPRVSLVYNGADHTRYHPAEREPNAVPQIVFTGRLIPQKGVHILLEAMRLLQQRGVSAQLKVAGSSGFGGSRQTRYMRSLKRLCPANTSFIGYQNGDALAATLRASDLYCCPSIWQDPFPLSALEAMATGLPVVASNVGGLPEALAEGGGVLVPQGDPFALADALEELLGNAARRHELGREALASFRRRFLWSCVRDAYLRIAQREPARESPAPVLPVFASGRPQPEGAHAGQPGVLTAGGPAEGAC